MPLPTDVKATIRRVSLKLAIHRNVLPSPLLLLGVLCQETSSRGVGGFADVYYGTMGGDVEVAIKRLRLYTAATETQKTKLKQVSRYRHQPVS